MTLRWWWWTKESRWGNTPGRPTNRRETRTLHFHMWWENLNAGRTIEGFFQGTVTSSINVIYMEFCFFFGGVSQVDSTDVASMERIPSQHWSKRSFITCTCLWLNGSQFRVELLYDLWPVLKWTLCHVTLPFSETKLKHTRTLTAVLRSEHFKYLHKSLLMSHSVVVDQFVGLHFVLRLDGWLAASLHTAVITSTMAQTWKGGIALKCKEAYCVFVFMMPATHICRQICIWLGQEIRCEVTVECQGNGGAYPHTTVHRAVHGWGRPVGEAPTKNLAHGVRSNGVYIIVLLEII